MKERDEAHAAVNRQKSAIERARASLRAAEKALAAAEENVTKAQQDHASALAEAAAADALAPASGVRAARQAVVDAQDEFEAAKEALAQLRRDLPARYEHAAREANVAVEAAVSQILAQHLRPLLDKAGPLAAALAPYRRLMFAFLNDLSSVGGDDVAAFQRGRRPVLEMEGAVRQLFETINAFEHQTDYWSAARERLRADPNAALPDLPEPPKDTARAAKIASSKYARRSRRRK